MCVAEPMVMMKKIDALQEHLTLDDGFFHIISYSSMIPSWVEDQNITNCNILFILGWHNKDIRWIARAMMRCLS
jgi:hypothetical protein